MQSWFKKHDMDPDKFLILWLILYNLYSVVHSYRYTGVMLFCWITWTICLKWSLNNSRSIRRLPFLVAQRWKRLPSMWETWVRSLGQEDPLEKEMAIHSSVLAWRIPRMEKPSRLQSTGSQRVGHGWVISPSPSP